MAGQAHEEEQKLDSGAMAGLELGAVVDQDHRAMADLDCGTVNHGAVAGLNCGTVDMNHEALVDLGYGALADLGSKVMVDLGHGAVAKMTEQGANLEQKATRSDPVEQEAKEEQSRAGSHRGGAEGPEQRAQRG